MSEILQLPNGYTAEICLDECAESPWKNGDCEPPILVFYDWGLNDQNSGLSLHSLFNAIPARKFDPKGRQEFIGSWGIELGDVSYYLDNGKGKAEDWKNAISCCLPDNPTGWRSAEEYFDLMELCAKLAGIPCFWKRSNGFCQRDSALVFLAATPEWMEKVGVSKENIKKDLENSFGLFDSWCWGGTWCVESIRNPNGQEVGEGFSVGGFYGSDHEKSGLIEYCSECLR